MFTTVKNKNAFYYTWAFSNPTQLEIEQSVALALLTANDRNTLQVISVSM